MNQKVKKLLEEHKKLFKYRSTFSSTLENIINEVSRNTGHSKKIIYQIVSAQFLMVKDTIVTSDPQKSIDNLNFDNYKSIRLIYLGSFVPSKNKFNKVKKALTRTK